MAKFKSKTFPVKINTPERKKIWDKFGQNCKQNDISIQRKIWDLLKNESN